VRDFKGVNTWCHNLVLHGIRIHTMGILLSEIEMRHLAYHHKVSLNFLLSLYSVSYLIHKCQSTPGQW
jgi:hypothetical protein